MGILRADRVSGLGGANAINGSAFFSGGTGIETAPFDDLYFGTNALTMEMWVYFTGFEPDFMTFLKTGDTNGANSMWQWDYKVSDNTMRFIPYVSDSSVVYASSWTPSKDTWYHIAVSKSGTSIKLWVDGTQIGSTHTFSQTWDNEVRGMAIGHRAMGSYERDFEGYMSNLRIINGTALYTANFTPPTTRLEKTSDTVFLAFQSPGDVLKEETGKILYPATDGKSSAPAVASRFVPDKGEDHGTTLGDNTKFDTLSYMVPPGGTTAQSNRGVGLYGGGNAPGADPTTQIASILIQSMGNSVDWGDLSVARYTGSTGASATRGIWAGGATPTRLNTIDYVTIATQATAQDFGDTQNVINYSAGASNSTRMVSAGGDTPTIINVMDLITIATAGNASDFGDLTVARVGLAEGASPTRGVFGGGWTAVPAYTPNDTIDYVTIATTGNATDFGNLSAARRSVSGGSSQTRSIFMGGIEGSVPSHTEVNTIEYITIASTGNATDFGDMTAAIRDKGDMMSNSIRCVGAAGYDAPATVNSIDMVTIATTGNAVDFGDAVTPVFSSSGLSDSHGGIS